MYQKCELVIVKDAYFSDFPSIRHMDNKHEARPHYLAIKGKDKIIWLVPLSSKVDKYKDKIARYEAKYKNCIFCCIAKVKGEERAFLTGNIIPVTEDYISHPFTISGRPYILSNQADIKLITSTARRYLALVRSGKIKPAVDILKIEKILLDQLKNQ